VRRFEVLRLGFTRARRASQGNSVRTSFSSANGVGAHSVRIAALPDWLLLFHGYDQRTQTFSQFDEGDLLAEALQMALVARLATGRFDMAQLARLLEPSRVADTPMEGLMLRHTERPEERAKLVRPEFLQAIDEHSRSQPIELNRLAGMDSRGLRERI
jgi:hypothetical protein